jgi:muramoyltetrapeptide carboxypeptidase
MNPPYRALQPGALIGVVAPAGPAEPEALALVEPLLARHGYRARLYPGCHARRDYLAGDDEVRLADLHAAFADAEVAAVFCLRGGYGSARLLGRIDADLVARAHTPLVGYSDITALHAWLGRAGMVGLHAPMPASDLIQPGRDADADALFALLGGGLRAGTEWAPALDASTLHRDGVAEGRLAGGNLSVVASLLGTPFACPVDDAILFLEDVGEEPYRVDRLLTQLNLAGVLAAARGFLLGSFTGQASPQRVLADALLPLGKPLLAGWPAGHGTPNRPLPLGARVRIDATRRRLTVLDDVIAT